MALGRERARARRGSLGEYAANKEVPGSARERTLNASAARGVADVAVDKPLTRRPRGPRVGVRYLYE